MKQGGEKIQFIKEEGEDTSKFVFQNNSETKGTFIFIAIVLIFLMLGVSLTGFKL